jgi:hypothetical protein
MTPTELVGANLRRARELRGWTQERAAKELEPYLGARWSKAVFSAAERSAGGERVRQFTPDELLAFARGFGLPITWFLLPAEASTWVATPDGNRPAGLLLDRLFDPDPALLARVEQLVMDLPDDGLGAQAQVDLKRAAERYYAAQVIGAVGEDDQVMAAALRRVLDILEKPSGPLTVAEKALQQRLEEDQ